MHSRGTYNQTQTDGRGSDVRVEVRRVANRKSCAKRRVGSGFVPIRALLLALCLGAFGGGPDDAAAGPREARENVIRALERLTSEARERGDRLAAQCLAEINSLVSGTPHADLDAIRRELRNGFDPKRADSKWLEPGLKPVEEQARLLASGESEMDRSDGGMALHIADAIAAVRRLNIARCACGLKPVRFDAKRSAKRVLQARRLDPACRRGDLDANIAWMLWNVARRAALLDPDDKGVAMGMWAHAGKVVSCVAMSGNKVVIPTDPREVVYPPRGAINVPRAAPTDDPLKKRLAANVVSAGPWITLLSYRPGAKLTVTKAVLRIPPGEVVPTQHWVEHASGLDLPRTVDAILLLPLDELEAGVDYEVAIEGTLGGEPFSETWKFSTGPKSD